MESHRPIVWYGAPEEEVQELLIKVLRAEGLHLPADYIGQSMPFVNGGSFATKGLVSHLGPKDSSGDVTVRPFHPGNALWVMYTLPSGTRITLSRGPRSWLRSQCKLVIRTYPLSAACCLTLAAMRDSKSQ